jgi:hypothetical protein
MNDDVAFLLKFIANGTRILSSRLLLILTLLLVFGLFVWAMILPTYERILTATIFAILVFLPIRAIDAKGLTNEATQSRNP